ncbi:Mini-ribonuclease 3 [Sarcina sp. JB2]|uniref:Mini-ribonuclease 3 n=1 Tax=Candidatus Sarcina troglodytae TaxID=2726954 RepID=A0ACD1BFL2_9CLOT|nr:ribonuclease III domain-containing protein [Sarcina sp. JB2]QPJ86190.1 Mini-ribonuclease 3 [Sarcina sp. JB2]
MDFQLFKNKFTKEEVRQLNPLVLAFIGDGVYEVFIRSYIIDRNRNMPVHKLHIKTISYVRAHEQSNFMNQLIELLNEEELLIYKRGRNAKSGTIPKNADVREYRNATGFEALIGYLYLIDNKERLEELLNRCVE